MQSDRLEQIADEINSGKDSLQEQRDLITLLQQFVSANYNYIGAKDKYVPKIKDFLDGAAISSTNLFVLDTSSVNDFLAKEPGLDIQSLMSTELKNALSAADLMASSRSMRKSLMQTSLQNKNENIESVSTDGIVFG